MTSKTSPFTVFAKDRGCIPTNNHTNPKLPVISRYDIPIVPRIPLRVGLRVRIAVIRELPAPDHALSTDEREELTYYRATMTDIEGRITGIRSLEKNVTELTVKNENEAAATEFAYLSIHHAEGLTVRLPLWVRLARAVLLRWLQDTRDIPAEDGAVIRFRPQRDPLEGYLNSPTTRVAPAEEWTAGGR